MAIYLSHINEGKQQQLLDVAQATDGSGASELKVVKKSCEDWGVEKELLAAQVFDTTFSNTGSGLAVVAFCAGGWDILSSGVDVESTLLSSESNGSVRTCVARPRIQVTLYSANSSQTSSTWQSPWTPS